MTDARVAKRYAQAVFNAAKKLNILQSVEDDLNGISAAIRDNERLHNFIKSPNASRGDKLALLEKVFSDRVTALTMHCLRLLLRKRREDLLDLVRLEYIRLHRSHGKILQAIVSSAKPLDEGQRSALVSKLEEKTGYTVQPEYLVDAKLLGGLKVQYDNFVLDGTVRGSLNRMRERIIYDLLKQS